MLNKSFKQNGLLKDAYRTQNMFVILILKYINQKETVYDIIETGCPFLQA